MREQMEKYMATAELSKPVMDIGLKEESLAVKVDSLHIGRSDGLFHRRSRAVLP